MADVPYPTLPPDLYGPPWAATGQSCSALDAALGPLLVRAGQEALSRFGRSDATRKGDGSPVTEADAAAQDVLVAGLRALFPDDSILAEEGYALHQGPRTWMVDPLDGTAAFSEGLAHWGPVVARTQAGTADLAALYLPRLREYYYVERGVGAFRNGAPLPTLPQERRLSRLSVLYVPSRLHAGANLDWPGKTRCLGSVGAHLALVAAGAGSAALIPPGWQAWDTAAGLALIEAVGGAAVLPDGTPLLPDAHAGLPFLAGELSALGWLTQPGRLTARVAPGVLDDRTRPLDRA